MPVASPPGPISTFDRDLDLPEVDHYSNEILRVVRGGVFPAIVAQFAVVRPGEPVQVVVIHAAGRAPWRLQSRKTGALPWSDYEDFRRDFLNLLASEANQARQLPPDLVSVCTDDGPGVVEFSGGSRTGLTATLDGCGHPMSVAFGDKLIASAENALSR